MREEIEIVAIVLGMEMTKQMDKHDIVEKVEGAKLLGEDIQPIVESTEPLVLEVIEEVTKPDEELDVEEREVEARITVELMNHNYRFFELEAPYDPHAGYGELIGTIENVKLKHAIKSESAKDITEEDEEVFIYDSLDNQ